MAGRALLVVMIVGSRSGYPGNAGSCALYVLYSTSMRSAVSSPYACLEAWEKRECGAAVRVGATPWAGRDAVRGRCRMQKQKQSRNAGLGRGLMQMRGCWWFL